MKFEEEIKSKFRNEYHKVRLNIYYTNNILITDIIKLLKPFDITMQQYNVLRILRGQHPHPVMVKQIRERLLDKNSDVSRIIDKLFAKGYVLRTECSFNRRQKDILISKKGLELLRQIDSKEAEMDMPLKKNLSLEEAKLLNELLDKIRG